MRRRHLGVFVFVLCTAFLAHARTIFDGRQPSILVFPALTPFGPWQVAFRSENYLGETQMTLSDGDEISPSFSNTYSIDLGYRFDQRYVIGVQFGKTRIIGLPFDVQLVGQRDFGPWGRNKVAVGAMLGFGRIGLHALYAHSINKWKKDRLDLYFTTQIITGSREYEHIVNSSKENTVTTFDTRLLPILGVNYNVQRPSGRGYEISLYAGWERIMKAKVDDEEFTSNFKQKDGLMAGFSFAVNMK